LGLFFSFSALIKIGVPKSSVAQIWYAFNPLSLKKRVKISAGR
jgi:hypothetical protein